MQQVSGIRVLNAARVVVVSRKVNLTAERC